MFRVLSHCVLVFVFTEIAIGQQYPTPLRNQADCSYKALLPNSTRALRGAFADDRIDVIYYKLSLNVAVSPEYLRGVVTVRAKSLVDSLTALAFDLSSGMTVDSILMNGSRLSFQRYTDGIGVTLDRRYGIGGVIELDIAYRGIPVSAGFGSFEFSSHDGTAWAWTLSEPYGAKDWWPCKDHPLDKADSVDVWVTCNSAFKVGSNGKLVAIVDNGNGTRTHKWAERYPIATYLVSIALTNYAEFSNWFRYTPTDSMEILNYVLPEHLVEAQASLPRTVDMLEIFSRTYGLYPFIKEKYGHSEFGKGGAMEHQTMTSTTTFEENTIAHELAHQWFGDLITCANWQSLWLNEGFAVYSEAVYREAIYGADEYWQLINDRMTKALRARGTLFVQDTSVVRELFDNDRVYSKGASVLHMLRHVLGDSVFFRSLRSYVADPRVRYSTATTEDFRRVCESVSGKQLGYFFDEWVYGEKFPQYAYQWKTRPSPAGYDVIVTIEQTTHTPNPSFFTMPVDFRLSTATWDTTVVLFHTHSGQQFTINVSHNPTNAALDPDHWILREIPESELPLPLKVELDQNYPNPFNAGTSIVFRLPNRANVTLKIYTVLGQEVATLVNERQEAGFHKVSWNGANDQGRPLPTGVYFCRLSANTHQLTKKIVVLR